MNLETRSIQLSAELCTAAEKKYGKQFANVEEFLRFVLEELVREDVDRLDEAERKFVEQRLKDLGYL
jgi:hypothetical protein